MSEADILQSFPHRFRDPDLARAALHLPDDRAEQLEFLGDRALNLAVADLLREHLPQRSLGEIGRAHAHLVSNGMLRQIAIELGLPGSENPSANRRRLPDTVEALLGAVFVDDGFEAAKACVGSLYGQRISEPEASLWSRDAKTELKEFCDSRGLKQPEYAIEAEGSSGFTASCSAASVRAVGEGANLVAAQNRAAEQVLAQIAEQAE